MDYLALVSNVSMTAAFVTDPNEYLVWVSRGFSELTGYSAEEVLGKRPGDLLRGENPDSKSANAIAASIEAGQAFEVELINYHKSGRPYWVRLTGTPIRDADGLLTHYVGIQVDITERKRQDLLYRTVLDGADDAIMSCDRGGVVETFNPGAERMFGWTRDEMVGKKTVFDFHVASEIRASLVEAGANPDTPAKAALPILLRTAGRAGDTAQRDWTYVRKDGSHFAGFLVMSAMRDSSGAIIGYVGIVRDVTEQKAQLRARAEAEERQRLEAARLRAIASHVPGVFYQVELNTDGSYSFPFVSEGLREIYGIEPEDVARDANLIFKLIHADDRARVDVETVRSMETLTEWQVDFRIARHDGSIRWLSGRSSPQRKADGGTVWNGVITDITQRRESEHQVRKLAAVVEQAVEGIVITTERGEIEYVNPAFEKMTGYTFEEVLGKNPSLLQSGCQDQTFYRLLWDTIGSGSVWHGTFKNRRKDGTLYSEEATMFPIRNELGDIRHFVGLKRDISREVALEEHRTQAEVELQQYARELERARDAERANARELERLVAELTVERDRAEAATRAKGNFLSAMSHEIRTPMNGIIGMTALLLDTLLDEEQREYASAVKFSSDLLLTIINDILEFSKIEAGKLAIESIPFNLTTVAGDVLDLLAMTANEKGIELVFAGCPDEPREFVGDGHRIRQILLNLTGNAIKFTSHGHVRLEIKAEEVADGKAAVRIEVQDTGIGISADRIPDLFQRFTQLDASSTRKFGGTGLGLAISKHLAMLMGGDIEVSSNPGSGSTFCLRLPLKIHVRGKVEPKTELAGRRVLIVDDSQECRGVLRGWCETWGMKVDESASGADAARKTIAAEGASHHFEFILLDGAFKGMDAETAIRVVRATEGANRARIIVLFTASQRGKQGRFTSAGCDATVAKPVRPAELWKALTGAN